MKVETPTSHMVRVRVYNLPKLDLDNRLCEQESAACEGIEVAAKLFAWYQKHFEDFEAWTVELLPK